MKARVMKSVAKMRGLDSAKFYKRREVIERLAVLFVYLSVFICILCVGVISYFLLKNGIDGIREIGLFKFLPMRKLSRILELPKKHEYRRKVAFCWKKSHFSVYKARKPVRIAAF